MYPLSALCINNLTAVHGCIEPLLNCRITFTKNKMMRYLFYYLSLLIIFFTVACNQPAKQPQNAKETLDKIAEQYVRLGLTIGQYDGDFVDAYYGPDSLKPARAKDTILPKDSLLKAVDSLINRLHSFTQNKTNDTLATRAKWLTAQLVAYGRRIKIFAKEYKSFDEESKELFGVAALTYNAQHFESLIQQLDSLLPGKGNIPERFQMLAKHFILPKEKLDTVFKTTIAEARKRTLQHYGLPAKETFTLEYVTDKPWSGYNYYKGNYKSDIQINVSLPIYLERALDLGTHEGYPGHHIFNALLEQNLYQGKGYVEISLYPLFSPQSLIAEGSANYAVEVAFPGNEQEVFYKNVLMPLAGLDTTNADIYFKALAVKAQLQYARNEAARGIVNGTMTDEQALTWLENYQLMTHDAAANYVRFIKKYRSYVINYNYGKDLVKNYIEAHGGTDTTNRWQLFGWLLSNQITPADLQ